MQIAAAVPVIPWSDLVYSLVPNGRTLDYQVTSDTADLNPPGIMKQSFVSGLFAVGSTVGYYAPPGADPDADLPGWYARITAGEPYGDPLAADIIDEVSRHHSAYYVDRSVAPAPLLIANGFTDDLFPADEAVRYANLVKQRHPSVPVAQLHFDFGHQRGQGKAADEARLRTRTEQWFDRHVKGDGSVQTLQGAEALTQTCPEAAPSGGPYRAGSWLDAQPRRGAPAQRAPQDLPVGRRQPSGGPGRGPDRRRGRLRDHPRGRPAGHRHHPPAEGHRLRLHAAGLAHVIADLKLTGSFPHVVARLWDVAPDGSTQTLVARGLYRPTASGRQVFQLHPNGWRFAAGHTAKLELLGRDSPYARPSNGTFSVEVSKVDLRLPVAEKPGTGPVASPAPNFRPGMPSRRGPRRAPVRSPRAWARAPASGAAGTGASGWVTRSWPWRRTCCPAG